MHDTLTDLIDLIDLIDHQDCPPAAHTPIPDVCTCCGDTLIYCAVAAAANDIPGSGYQRTHIHTTLTVKETC